jgi:hypothetical protein
MIEFIRPSRPSMRAKCSFQNLRDTNCDKHHRRAARIGRTLANAENI